jgi:site-specific DNA-methyltransferase (adenine-specific)
MAMFPPSIPNYFIQLYSQPGDIVLDQFSGRGTAPLEACALGRTGIGSDKNPLAYVLTKSKVQTPSRERVIERLYQLWGQCKKAVNIDLSVVEWEIRMLFHNYTLNQLLFLKNNLNWRRSTVDNFITAMILGIMHGKSLGYLSISMPNTFSMSPNYVKNYIKKNGLNKHKRDVFELLLKKLDRCYQMIEVKGETHLADARRLSFLKECSVDMSITSPPYTRVIRYGDFNWIRLWLLGKGGKETDRSLFCSGSLEKYKDFMTEVLEENWRVLKHGSKAIYVIGDVKNKENDDVTNLAQFVWDNCAKAVGFRLSEQIIEDRIVDSRKVSRIWGETKGNATIIDRVMILEKS